MENQYIENLTLKNNLTVQGTTDSTSLNTGALTIAGGASVSKNLFVGGQVFSSTIRARDIELGMYCESLVKTLSLMEQRIKALEDK